MSTSFGRYEAREEARTAKIFEARRNAFKPVQLLDQALSLVSVDYKPTKNGTPRWIGQVLAAAKDTNHVKITLWQEDIDFLNRVKNLAIGTTPIELDNVMIITGHCHSKFGLSQIDVILSKNGLVRKGDEMPEPDPTPIAKAKPKTARRGYLHLRDLLQKNGVVSLPHGDVLAAKMHVLVRMGYAVALPHNQWVAAPKETATPVTPATVAQVEVLPSPEQRFAFKVGDKVLFDGKLGNDGKPHKIVHRIDEGSGGKTWYGVQKKVEKGYNVIFCTEEKLTLYQDKKAKKVA